MMKIGSESAGKTVKVIYSVMQQQPTTHLNRN